MCLNKIESLSNQLDSLMTRYNVVNPFTSQQQLGQLNLVYKAYIGKRQLLYWSLLLLNPNKTKL